MSDETWSSAGREFQTTALETAKSLVPSIVLVLRTTSFRASADLCWPQIRPARSRRPDTLAPARTLHSDTHTRAVLKDECRFKLRLILCVCLGSAFCVFSVLVWTILFLCCLLLLTLWTCFSVINVVSSAHQFSVSLMSILWRRRARQLNKLGELLSLRWELIFLHFENYGNVMRTSGIGTQ